MIFYKILFTMILFVASLNAIEQTNEIENEVNNQTESAEENDFTVWRGHDQYLFLQFALVLPDKDSFEWGTDIDEKEKEFGLVYYLQITGPFYAKGSIGKAEYTYTESYISSGALIERKDVKFNYIQAGLAYAMYEDKWGIITVDLDYMKPYSASATKERSGVVTSIEKPDPRAVLSLNASFCVNHVCFGGGFSSTRYYDGAMLTLRIGTKF